MVGKKSARLEEKLDFFLFARFEFFLRMLKSVFLGKDLASGGIRTRAHLAHIFNQTKNVFLLLNFHLLWQKIMFRMGYEPASTVDIASLPF